MNTKHTPGPWMVATDFDGKLICRYPEWDDSNGRSMRWPIAKSSDKKDARLIAAAPELLEALRMLAGEAGVGLDRLECSNAKADIVAAMRLRPVIKSAYAAIAKATGEGA